MIHFSIPDFFYNFNINAALLKIMDENKDMVNDDIIIDSVYGSFPNAIWNGGRTCIGGSNAVNVERTLAFFNNRGIACRYTFTNSLLEEKHLHDSWCNLLMDKANNGKNAVIVASDLLSDYLSREYPRFERISSTTKCLNNLDAFNQECKKDFSLCVLPYELNNDKSALGQINSPQKVEIVVNEYCEPKCPLRKAHYKAMSEAQLNFAQVDFPKPCACDTYADVMTRPHYVSYQDIIDTYVPMGFNNYKVVGRFANKYDLAESYIQYFFKPEYQIKARIKLLSAIG